ncbi:tRNA synthetases class II (D, K and N) [Musa troglodytarum]|uniref:tRNA synthetases class II (D, K and N) n=1 Tax=Musa troglodytarum TaxID=320322 RepID=A0A9E7F5N1_9LILI|nr:tRNA synthetases class II (D, K and N) [Musa troglodytarum]
MFEEPYLGTLVTRVRNALAYATHKFFQENGFVWISSPIITASDCEGAGEQFCVTTLCAAGTGKKRNFKKEDQEPHSMLKQIVRCGLHISASLLVAIQEPISKGLDQPAGSHLSGSTGPAPITSFKDLVLVVGPAVAQSVSTDVAEKGGNILISNAGESDCPLNSIPTTEEGNVDWSQDFFGKPAFLTVSGQLNAETYASAFSDVVYTFGPTFRAENSNTSRHLAEFWMIEPELAFADLNDDMACATAYLQYVAVVEKDFIQLTYSDAVELLLKSKKKFEFPVKWGLDLQSEHERYITEIAFGGRPVIIRDYPKEIKAFYMRQNDDGKTVAAMDLLVPRVGELIGGSQREERLDYLESRLDELKLNKDSYWWYLDLRRFGSVPHAGFGLGFERLVQFATGIENIRDAIPFPRSPGSADF